ncbi:glycosyl hydrolase family 18 protein [Nitrospirillum sp. BR 11752]|uniref:glycosyl hydrolase family 18 protein n=1 Tax=Nitrospirillum sp. BR 11752 TaxID=3104293 RepID=UPI002EBA0E21|nr:glycosyl hydrolase family 18 protein [Nitrospirillum sp. BR 11752]
MLETHPGDRVTKFRPMFHQIAMRRIAMSSFPIKTVNAWILLSEDDPAGTTYPDSNSAYQALITNKTYLSMDMIFLCFGEIVQASTLPDANMYPYPGAYTLVIQSANHVDSTTGNTYTNQQYMKFVIDEANSQNSNIKIAITLDFGNSGAINQIFDGLSGDEITTAADQFAANLLFYMQGSGLIGFDIDWEPSLSSETTTSNFIAFITAIGTLFQKQATKYYLTMSPSEAGNLDPSTVNSYVDFLNLQLYGGANPNDFPNINQNLFAYGAKFECDFSNGQSNQTGKQTAQEAFNDNLNNYKYAIMTNWRINSSNFQYEQSQQAALFAMVLNGNL